MIFLWWSQKHVDELMFKTLRSYRKFDNFTFSMLICVVKTFSAFANSWCSWIVLFSIFLILVDVRFRNDFVWCFFHLFFQNLTKWFVSFFCENCFCLLIVFCFSMISLKRLNHVFFWFAEMNFDFLCLFLSFLSDRWIFHFIFSILS